jgi:hypothetical protein
MKTILLFAITTILLSICSIVNAACPDGDYESCGDNCLRACDLEQTTVQAAIDAAKDGYTIELPPGTATWTSLVSGKPCVTVTEKKFILKGSGIDVTTIVDGTDGKYGSYILEIDNDSGAKPFRITGITFKESKLYGIHMAGLGWRIDHCKFLNTNGAADISRPIGRAEGIFDHCEFYNGKVGIEADNKDAWERPLSLGTENAIYIENCKFEEISSANPSSIIHGSRGGRVVVRNCDITDMSTALHGIEGNANWLPDHGSLSWEVYNNNFMASGRSGLTWVRLTEFRGGTGVFFNNTITGNGKIGSDRMWLWIYCACWPSGSKERIKCDAEMEPYPHLDQLGRAPDTDGNGVQDLVPIMEWNNYLDGKDIDFSPKATCARNYEYLQENRDYYNDTVTYNQESGYYEATYIDDDGSEKLWQYKPYIYPHPLINDPFVGDEAPSDPPSTPEKPQRLRMNVGAKVK